MKIVLALAFITITVQNCLIASWEHDAMHHAQERFPLSYKYKNIREHITFGDGKYHDLRLACEFAPRGWFGKNTIETACDILYKQFDIIAEYVKKELENNQSSDCSNFKESPQFIEEKDARELLGIILDSPVNGGVVTAAWNRLNDDYEKYCKEITVDTLRSIKVADLSKKYSN